MTDSGDFGLSILDYDRSVAFWYLENRAEEKGSWLKVVDDKTASSGIFLRNLLWVCHLVVAMSAI